MLAEFFESPSLIRKLRDGSHGHLLESFADELCQAGYAVITARGHIRAAEHFLSWTDREVTPAIPLDQWSTEGFARHLDRCQCARFGRSHKRDLLNGARLFLDHLRRSGRLKISVAEPSVQDPVLLTSFCRWMGRQR